MKIDWNKIFNRGFDSLDKLISIYRPTLARALIVPTVLAGVAILSPPWWLELLNWLVTNQDTLVSYKKAISETNPLLGWCLLGYSLIVFILESLKLLIEKKIDTSNKISEETANLVVKKLGELPSNSSHIIDEKIEQKTFELQQLRFFQTYPKKEKAIQLADNITKGEFTGGSAPLKALGLALASRYLALGEDSQKSKEYFSEARNLAEIPEIAIAEAFIKMSDSDFDGAISLLSVQDSGTSRSAIFMLKRFEQGAEEAVNWVDKAHLSIDKFDSDGQTSFLSALIETQQWDRALKETNVLRKEVSSYPPALAQIMSFIYLANSVKVVELRESVMQQVPFAAESFPLADDSISIMMRNEAATMFKVCSDIARSLRANDVVDVSEKYALWLELRNPDSFNIAEKKLEKYFTDKTAKALDYLPLAFAFRVELDYEAIEHEVNKQTALCNNTNPTLGVARFVLAHKQGSYAKAIEYIDTHREQLEKFVNPVTVKMFDIEVHAKAGLTEDAKVLLSEIDEKLIGTEEMTNLNNIIAMAQGEDPIALSVAQYNETGKVSDLAQLVQLLKISELKDKFLEHAIELFNLTGTEPGAINVANAYSSTGNFPDLHLFLEQNMDLVKRSSILQMHWAWSLFRRGDLVGSRNQVATIKDDKVEYLDLDTLDIHLNIFSGNWDALTRLVESRWENKDQLDEVALLQTAQLAKAQSPSRAKEILEYATNRYPNDPQVLSSAYFTATTMGWEDNQNTADWLNKAAILSVDNGPLKSASFDEMKEMIYEQREQSDRVYKAYQDNEAPIFTIAEFLNRSLSDFYLIQPFENLKTTNFHRKSVIAAFHCVRNPKVIETDSITIDVSSVLMIGYLGLLKPFFKVFNKILVSHSLLRWLYEEKQKVAFHQPSQIAKAKSFESLILDECIQVTESRLIESPQLALNVGDELAMFLELSKSNQTLEDQVLVVSSYPVFHVGSFRKQKVDLSAYHKNLISCSSLIRKLKELSLLTEEEYNISQRYLEQQQHGEQWPAEPVIEDNAQIYLDSLSVTYLMALGVLEKFKDTDIKLFVHAVDFNRHKRLRSFDSTINKADVVLDKIKAVFAEGLESGQVSLSEMLITPEKRKGNLESTPIAELFQKSAVSEGILIDDRYINQNANIQIDDVTEPVFTTLDLLETLCLKDEISENSKYTHRAKLRESGFGIITASNEEIQYHLDRSSLKLGVFRPSKELLLIKQHLSLLKTSGLIKLPRDAQWLHMTLKCLSNVIKDQWTLDIPLDACRARSNWLFELVDFRSWAQCHDIRSEDGFGYFGESIRINMFLISAESLSDDKKVEYNKWLEEYIILPLKNNDPTSFDILVTSVKGMIRHTSEDGVDKLEEQSNG